MNMMLQQVLAAFRRDVRIPFCLILAAYVSLGLSVLGFGRSVAEVLLTVVVCVGLDYALNKLFRKDRGGFPWSGCITGLGLSILLNYGYQTWLVLLPAFLAIASKHLFTFEGRHAFNPGMFGVVAAVFLADGLISPSPAYQWGGSTAIAALVATMALAVFVFRINRTPLLVSFFVFYSLQMLLRAYVMRHHLPMETIILGTYTSAPFFLFMFYMITDPMTSPQGPRAQIATALAITVVDLFLHMKGSYTTLFRALFVVQAAVLVWRHGRSIFAVGVRSYWRARSIGSYAKRLALIVPAAALLVAAYGRPALRLYAPPAFTFSEVPASQTGITSEMSNVLEEVDPRVRHIAKWILSVGDAVAVADLDCDGDQDVFLTNTLKRPEDRCALYLNEGPLSFVRAPLPAMDERCRHPEQHGLPACAVFADYDNDGDQDLFVGMGYGPSVLLRNTLMETGQLLFEDVSLTSGTEDFAVCLAALFVDYDQDGRLDLFFGHALAPLLPGYSTPTPLTIFNLPQPEHPGDRRMFHFMHSTWNNAENGGTNVLFRNAGGGTFQRLNATDLKMPESHWTLAINAADLNQDGWPDLYCANDFGPDDCYLNESGRSFRRLRGTFFGTVGRDTYKGMNCSIADFDRNGWLDVYVSNVHAPLQAEGSLLWMLRPGSENSAAPEFSNEAARRGALNEKRFGWGAAAGDLDHDGWTDIVQVNGLFDDRLDKRFEKPRDYWYVNEKLARTGPEVHAYADMWGDIRGYSIWGRQKNRVLLNDGGNFTDVAELTGLAEPDNARGAALADFDNDGDLDLLITHQHGPATIYSNTLAATAANWIGLDLRGDGVAVNRDAINVRVELTCGDGSVTQCREVQNVTGFSAQGDRRLLFGLGSVTNTASARIIWKHGIETTVGNLAPGRYHRLEMQTNTAAEKNPVIGNTTTMHFQSLERNEP